VRRLDDRSQERLRGLLVLSDPLNFSRFDAGRITISGTPH